eukprot:2482249-Pleurochrysis_carterae.AAC.1
MLSLRSTSALSLSKACSLASTFRRSSTRTRPRRTRCGEGAAASSALTAAVAAAVVGVAARALVVELAARSRVAPRGREPRR